MKTGVRHPAWLAAMLAPACLCASSPAALAKARPGYVIEFRSRPGPFIGHSYVVTARLTADGRMRTTRMAGLLPDRRDSFVNALWGMRGRIGSNNDDRTIPPDERFRVTVSKRSYDRAVSTIDRNRRRTPTFAVFDQNCTSFVQLVARSAGLKAPDSFLHTPQRYIRDLRSANS